MDDAIFADLKHAQKLYEDAGVDGSDGARMMKIAADTIEALKAERDRYRDALDAERHWSFSLADCLGVQVAQHGSRNASRVLKDFRDYCAHRTAINQEPTE